MVYSRHAPSVHGEYPWLVKEYARGECCAEPVSRTNLSGLNRGQLAADCLQPGKLCLYPVPHVF